MEASMNMQWGFLLLVTLGATTPALGRAVAPTVAPADSGKESAASIPDFSGICSHQSIPGFEPPASGPGPVTNRSRLPNGVGNVGQLVGDYTDPILKPQASDTVKKHGEISLAGVTYPNPRNQCWPGGVPFIFSSSGMQMLQQADKITIIYDYDHQVRRCA
jgi:hypothetical protein